MTDFIEEIFGFILPQLGVIEMDGLVLVGVQLQLIRGKGVIKQMASIMYA
jgi:hypothetical protein